MKIKAYDIKGKSIEGGWDVKEAVFGKPNPAILSQAVRIYTSNLHQKTSKVKTRGEVVGSTRKIYRQKGTGNARHGAKYAPIFVGGGIAHGPTGVRPENMVLPKTMRRRALAAAILSKLADKSISGVSGVKAFSGKTSAAAKLLATIALHPKQSVLVVTSGKATSLYLAISNLQGVSMKRASLINAYDLIASSHIIITKPALAAITTRAQKEEGAKSL